MSSRWPRETQDVQPWQDSGWHDADGAEQWGAAQGFGSSRGSVAQAVAQQTRNPAADDYQREWERSAGGFGDDADYEWFEYLSGARSAQPKPADVPAQRRSAGERRQARPKPGREERQDKARRGGARTERSPSRRHGKPAPPDPENGWPGHAEPGILDPERSGPGQDWSERTGPRLGQPESAEPGYVRPEGPDAGYGQPGFPVPGSLRPEFPDPGYR